MSIKKMTERATRILTDYGIRYEYAHKEWLIKTGVHPQLAQAIIDAAKESINNG